MPSSREEALLPSATARSTETFLGDLGLVFCLFHSPRCSLRPGDPSRDERGKRYPRGCGPGLFPRVL